MVSCLNNRGDKGVQYTQDINQFPQPVQVAANHLAKELGVPPEQVFVGLLQEVQWNDASLGVDEQDGVYLCMITPGFRVGFVVAGQKYGYHTDARDIVKRVK
jgi:hypothetical protein